jgi:hypothetical protein
MSADMPLVARDEMNIIALIYLTKVAISQIGLALG